MQILYQDEKVAVIEPLTKRADGLLKPPTDEALKVDMVTILAKLTEKGLEVAGSALLETQEDFVGFPAGSPRPKYRLVLFLRSRK